MIPMLDQSGTTMRKIAIKHLDGIYAAPARNPLAFAQGVNMTAAASGSNGIQVADSVHLDQGTGAFTLSCKRNLASYVVAAILMEKHDDTTGYRLSTVVTTGYLKLEINDTVYTSNVAPAITGGTEHEFTVTASPGVTNTTVIFYCDGIIVGTAQTATNETTTDNAVSFYAMGTDAIRTAGITKGDLVYNRALTAAQVLSFNRNGVDFSDKWGSQTELMPNVVDRDFSAASAWADVDLVAGSGAYDEAGDLTITAGAAGANDYCTLPVASAPTTIAKRYRMTYDLANLVGTWTLKNFTGVQTIGSISANATQAKIEWVATTTGGYRLIAVSNNASGDFDNFTLTEIGATLALEGEGINATNWQDSSTNNLDASYPAAGSSLVRTILSASETEKGVVELATDAETAAFESETLVVTPEGLGYAMAGLLGYGVEWDEDDTSPTLTRIGALAGIAAASSPGNACLPIQAAMRRCLLADDGTVNYYLDASDSTKKEDGATASVLDGTDGQVMVEMPKFAFKYAYNTVTNVHSWLISSVLLPGFEWHPAFYKNGAWVDHRYIGAYEGIGYDASVSAYIDNGNVAATGWSGTTINVAADKLSSVSGKNPITDETRAEFRAIAANRGTGWRQQDFYLSSAIQLLYVTEYASWNSQSMIGMGRTQLTGGTWVQGSYIKETGLSNGNGNGTNAAAYAGDADDVGAEAAYMTYRGIENFFGNIWKWVDGFNINDGIPYVSNVDTDFADNTATGTGSTYARLLDINGAGITLPQGTDDYQSTLEQIAGGFLPSALGGSSSTYITDYYYQAAGWRVATLGGYAYLALLAGVACWYLYDSSADDSARIGGRLCF